jgi:MFS family permease
MLTLHPIQDTSRFVSARPRLPPALAFYLLASITVSFLAGSSAPTPLYAFYRAQWGFSPILVTIIFGIYAIAVLVTLLFAGRLSDHIGRRPILLVTIAMQAAAMGLFATAHGVSQLMAARVLQGLAAGAAVATLGAGMLDLNKTHGTTANAVAPSFGTALGAVLAGFMVAYLPAPTYLVYTFLATIFIAQGVGVYFMRETVTPIAGALASLKPQFRLPRTVRQPLVLALPVLIAAWALAGFYASLGPMLVRGLMGSSSPMLGGLSLFALAASGGIAVLVLRHSAAPALMSWGAAALMTGVGITLAALPLHSLLVFFLGTAVAGMGFGIGFQGAVRGTLPAAAPHERAGVLSIVFIVAYLAFGIPAVAAGALVARHGDILETAREFGGVVMSLALLALLAGAVRSRRHFTGQRVLQG